MGNPKKATSKSGAGSSRDSSLRSRRRRFSSSSDLWPEVAPEEMSRRGRQLRKSLSTSRDQLLYLQALFPYAAYDELMSVITKTDGPDEAAEHAYEAFNPDYTGYLYLKEQTDVMGNTKSTKAQRATAFSGLKESLEERAADALRAGAFGNLSQLQEYHETVGLFAIDTTEWDRAMLLPARSLAEMAFMDLPLRDEPSSSSASSCSDHADARTDHEQHAKPRLLSLALDESNSRFMDSSFVRQRTGSCDTAVLSPEQPREKRGGKPRDGCRTPIASAATPESGQRCQAPQEQEETGMLYLQDSDPVCKAPIIAWAPEAIRVGPAEALRQQEGALRVFDEATFFTDPLLAHKGFSTPLQTPLKRVTFSPSKAAAATAHGADAHRSKAAAEAADVPPLLAVSPNVSPRTAAERHEPVDSASDSLPFIGDDEEEEEDVECEVEESAGSEVFERADGRRKAEKNCVAGNGRRGRVEKRTPPPPLLELRDVTSNAVFSEFSRKTEDGDVRGSAVEHQPDCTATSHSDVSMRLARQVSLRETTVETLKTRKRRPLTSSEKIKQRMRTLKPVGNLVFRENPESSPTVATAENVFGEDDGRHTPAASHSTRMTATTLENALYTEGDIYADRPRNEGAPPVPGSGSQVLGSAAADAATATAAAGPSSSSPGEHRDRVYGQVVTIPAAHAGCSSLDPAAYLNSEEERWSGIVEVLKPFEEVFGSKFRCELVRCVHDDCPVIRPCLTELLQRLLHVVGMAVLGVRVAEGFAEEPMDLPLFGSILLSTSPVKLHELVFREEKCKLIFCDEGTRLQVKLNVKKVKLEPIQFAYIDEAAAARQNREAEQARRKMPQPRSNAAAWTLRHNTQEKYEHGVTRGTATISAANVKLKGIVYVWLTASGKVHVAFQEAKVSVGSFHVSTDVSKLNFLFTVGSPLLRLFVERVLLDAVKGMHTF
ncbi:hypothetical protein ABB37_04314 [Leptomonas pyrrhocoris]|uniref:Uncharacterized protein n=1 Tax=Leptomonas pyrrhocoris TaxID=157538 RepID=A0A0M9G2H8_LEPPY|nr:hypothetical protein ABB37_04314 [Leptomonas pyrrhocoris]KPA80913.1 hypothetical protein ABB37_04314 [Leptomonas pyrrhocoris]|eukprot:XP_015659352.1 hypothetical protein ABB37_04314 [Leptomonas pyrrhocoris]